MIEIRNLTLGYHAAPLLSDIAFDIAEGELVGVIGRNGSGKSTLLRTIAGLHRPLSGSVSLNGVSIFDLPVNQRAKAIGYAAPGRVQHPFMTVNELVLLGRTPHQSAYHIDSDEDHAAVLEALNSVGMQDFIQRKTHALSDGEYQKVVLARVMAQKPKLLVLDEPTAFLDYVARQEVVELLRNLVRHSGCSVIYSTHEVDLAREFCDKLVVTEFGTAKIN